MSTVQYDKGTSMFSVQVLGSDGTTTTKCVNFAALCLLYVQEGLSVQDQNFKTQFENAQQQVNQITELNNCMQMLNKYSNDVSESDGDLVELDGRVDTSGISEAAAQEKIDKHNNNLKEGEVAWGYQMVDGKAYVYEEGSDYDAWMTQYYPHFVESGLVGDGNDGDGLNDGIGVDGSFCEEEFNSFMDNLSGAQSTASSQNEQQMLLTNDAANKRSSILQQAQALMQAAADSRKTAAQTV